MKTWPDGTPKSTGNAFDWRGKESKIFKTTEFRIAHANMLNMAARGTEKGNTFTIYSKARPST